MWLLTLYPMLAFSIVLNACLLCDYKQGMLVEAHKLLSSSGSDDNSKFTSAMTIPNHTISWAIYQTLDDKDGIEARFYKFNNTQINSSFYAQIVIPKIDQFVNFTPSIMLLEPKFHEIKDNNIVDVSYHNNSVLNDSNTGSLPFGIPTNYQIMINEGYNDSLPSSTIYEPFTQTSYWERQEVNSKLDKLGTYYIIVYSIQNNSSNNTLDQNNIPMFGKFSLAVGKVEDFSILDLLVLIPYSWINVKLFFNDYWSLMLGIGIFVLMVIVIPIILFLRRKRK
jgi:hypothetical protein